MDIQHNISLKPYNTFGIDARASFFAEISDRKDLSLLFQSASILPAPADRDNMLVLGGGSNVLFTKDFRGLVAKICLQGIEIIQEDKDVVVVRAGAGVNWDDLVAFCVEKGYGGLENLSGIPGSVGAAPIQNIGAYGSEMKDCFESLLAYRLEDGSVVEYDPSHCHFGYRESIFKNQEKNNSIILSVSFRLAKKPVFNLTYKALSQYLAGIPEKSLSLGMVRDAVLSIRSSKLPDPSVLGNAGSFFKNPQVDSGQLDELLGRFPDIVYFPAGEEKNKIAAGWLIESCGWKGFRSGDAGVHARQALVLVNYGNATGQQILDLAREIQRSVRQRFGIELEPEVRII